MIKNIFLFFIALSTSYSEETPAVVPMNHPEPSSKFNSASPGKNYVYKDIPGNPQNLEIYLPPRHKTTEGKSPGMLLIHGGGWNGGDLKMLRYQANYFASRGLVVANINYRMHKKNGPPPPEGESRKRICVTDAKSAIRWFKQHASEWGMDSDRLIIGGGSAGGHIAVLATLNNFNDPSDPKDIDTHVVAYVLFNPAFVVEGDGTGHKDPENDDQVNPLKFLRPGLAPFLFMFGSNDEWKPASELLIPRLRAEGAEVTLRIAENQKHGFFNSQPWADVTLAEADRFLVNHGLLKERSTLKPSPNGERLISSP